MTTQVFLRRSRVYEDGSLLSIRKTCPASLPKDKSCWHRDSQAKLKDVFAAMMEYFAGFLCASSPCGMRLAKSSDGTEFKPTSTTLSRLKRSCEKRIANCAGSPTPFRRQLWC